MEDLKIFSIIKVLNEIKFINIIIVLIIFFFEDGRWIEDPKIFPKYKSIEIKYF